MSESYAGDIVYHTTSPRERIDQHNPMDVLLFFREQGVTMCQTSCLTNDNIALEKTLQTRRSRTWLRPH